jgi:hypothetical protein
MSDLSLQKEYKEHYLDELKRKDALGSALTIPIGILTVLGSILFYAVSNLSRPLAYVDLACVGFVIVAAISIILSIYYLVRSFSRFTPYRAVPTPVQLNSWRTNLQNYYSAQGVPKTDAELDAFVLEYIYKKYAELCHVNSGINDLRSNQLHSGISFLVYAIILAFIGGGLSLFNVLSKGDKTYKVMIVSPPVVQAPLPKGD